MKVSPNYIKHGIYSTPPIILIVKFCSIDCNIDNLQLGIFKILIKYTKRGFDAHNMIIIIFGYDKNQLVISLLIDSY